MYQLQDRLDSYQKYLYGWLEKRSSLRDIFFLNIYLYIFICFFTDDENSLVHGMVTSEGLFDGTIFTASDEIYIEPANRYSSSSSSDCHRLNSENDYRCGNQSDDLRHHHTIAYRSRDISVLPTQSCASEELFHRTDRNRLRNNNETGRNGYLLAGGTMRPFYQHVNEGTNRAKPGFYPMDARKKDPMASSHNLELLDKLYRERYSRILRKRTSIDPKKTTCMLYLQADHTFFEHYKSEEACIEVMTRHVQRVNSIYRHTDFNQDGQPDNISFMIKRVKVHGEEALHDSSYRFTGDYGVEEFLELFSEEDYDAFCLSYMFTYRDFEKGTLGLAWTGDLKNAGGVCEKNGHYRGSMKSLNTGIITLLNYGKHVPPTVSHVTLAHEIGHNFGSPVSLQEPALSLTLSLVEPQSAICGNGVVEEGEECDCGWEEDCNDPCCHPQRLHHVPHEIPCRLADGAVCSPSQGPCCTSACTLRSGDKCRDDNGCRDASFCDGRGPQCPPSINKPNKTICNEEFVCYMGSHTDSFRAFSNHRDERIQPRTPLGYFTTPLYLHTTLFLLYVCNHTQIRFTPTQKPPPSSSALPSIDLQPRIYERRRFLPLSNPIWTGREIPSVELP
ncbi:hypothetical protein M0802_003257 [Mischocyttarus mexicanus]|nr:hypothetical protein M0802_003257 [Mischocyttarus mexicanus]